MGVFNEALEFNSLINFLKIKCDFNKIWKKQFNESQGLNFR